MMQILGLLDMYFDAAVVEVEKNSFLFRLALAMLCMVCIPKFCETKFCEMNTCGANFCEEF